MEVLDDDADKHVEDEEADEKQEADEEEKANLAVVLLRLKQYILQIQLDLIIKPC